MTEIRRISRIKTKTTIENYMKFSERLGIVKAKDTLQIDSIDCALRNSIWNLVQVYYFDPIGSRFIEHTSYNQLFRNLWQNHLKFPIDTMQKLKDKLVPQIRTLFFEWEWFEIYDFIEFLSNEPFPNIGDQFRDDCNKLFERELSGYRFISGILAQITNANEIEEIDSAISNSTQHNLTGVKTHLESALIKLADRNSPDYRNSIKESISAVEAISKVISNNSKDSLGGALDKIKGKINLHPSLERGFKQIYGYTSDSDGIRHALTEESTCDFEDAKYMLVSSSAFVNYLIVKASKAGIEI